MLNVYVTSSERKSGKSFISSGIAATMQSLGFSTSFYKPIQTAGIEINGFMQSPDITFIKSIDPYINSQFTYLFKHDFDALTCSELENKPIDAELILSEYKRLCATSDCTVIDGNNGFLTPVSNSFLNSDLIKKLSIPLLIVTTPSSDSANNTLMTINCALEKGIDIRGVVINNIEDNCSKTLLTSISRIVEEYTNVKVLGLVPSIKGRIRPEDLISAVLNGIDVESIFNVKIEKLDMN